jgi:hypothetical protein
LSLERFLQRVVVFQQYAMDLLIHVLRAISGLRTTGYGTCTTYDLLGSPSAHARREREDMMKRLIYNWRDQTRMMHAVGLAGMEGHEELAAWIASQEMKLVQVAMTQEASFEPPAWLVQVPEGVAMLTRSSELVFEPWGGFLVE